MFFEIFNVPSVFSVSVSLKVLLLTSEVSCEASSVSTSTSFKGTDWKLLMTNSKSVSYTHLTLPTNREV